MNRGVVLLFLAIATPGCGSYLATDGRRFDDSEAAVRASAEHDMGCASSARIIQSGFRSGRVSSAYWRVTACGHEVVYREASGGLGIWQIVRKAADAPR